MKRVYGSRSYFRGEDSFGTSKIMPYDSHRPDQFAVEKERVAQSFGPELADIYHVGSTAVPGLAAKPEIDLLIEIAEHREQETRDACMRMLGYVREQTCSECIISIAAMLME